ncbi:DUF3616 domain-containing protein [Ensifer sp. NBAIM29]|nr:DUF3616 domain-containing protein [Ensifer sp. NBAIM29]
MNKVRVAALVVAVVTGISGRAATADGPQVEALKGFTVEPSLSVSDKEATNVSGAACHVEKGAVISCLMIGDEVRYARIFLLDRQTIEPGGKLFLLPKKDEAGKKFDETDAEGVAYADGYYYIAGSHGLSKSGEKQSSRYFLYRIPAETVDHSDGDVGSPSEVSSSVTRTAIFDRILSEDAVLRDTANLDPENGGNNIEGLAVNSGKLFLGFRGPVLPEGAVIAETPISTAFDDAPKTLKFHFVDLGAGQGIRDLAAFEDGLLILSGPQDRQGGVARIYFWKPDGSLKLTAELAEVGSPEHQPEVLMVASRDAEKVRLIVIEDGPLNGAPKLYEISPPNM